MSDKLERQLREAFGRVEAPAGFSERVLARAAKEDASTPQPRAWLRWFGTGGLRWAAACALCVSLATSGILYHYEREKQGERAKQELMLALRITSSKLQIAAESVEQVNLREQREP
jgi:hypothetical protein